MASLFAYFNSIFRIIIVDPKKDKKFIIKKLFQQSLFLKITVKEILHKNSSWLQPYMFDYENTDKERLLTILF